jgi:hypothetical protein
MKTFGLGTGLLWSSLIDQWKPSTTVRWGGPSTFCTRWMPTRCIPPLLSIRSASQLQPIPEMGPVGEVRLMPDYDAFRILPNNLTLVSIRSPAGTDS